MRHGRAEGRLTKKMIFKQWSEKVKELGVDNLGENDTEGTARERLWSMCMAGTFQE